MKFPYIPYIHFLSIIDECLFHPSEIDDNHGGDYFIPVDEDGHFFECYKFDYCYYEQGTMSGIKTEIAITHEYKNNSEFINVSFKKNLTGLLLRKNQSYDKTFEYKGKYRHLDFQYKFLSLEPTRKEDLDNLLKEHKISIIGCYPWTNYKF